MKISFPNRGSGALISIRAAINALLNGHKAERAQTAAREKNVPRITSQWDYRPKKPIRSRAGCDSPSPETSEVLSPEPFERNNVWSNDNSLEATSPTFINGLDAEELMPKVLSETTDPVCTAASITRPFRRTTKVL